MSDSNMHFRVAIVGSNRARVAKVLSLLHCVDGEASPSSSTTLLLPDFPQEPIQRQVHVEYVPCTATFDSYQNENDETVRYLTKLEYHGKDGQSRTGSSLAPFFDEIVDDKDMDGMIPGIAAMVIGCGIESQEDVSMISSFIRTLSGLEIHTSGAEEGCSGDEGGKKEDEGVSSSSNSKFRKIRVECIKPNEEYSSMKEETLAYKNMSPSEKEKVTEKQLIGPGKMAKFTREVAILCISRTKISTDEEGEEEKVDQETGHSEEKTDKEDTTTITEDPLSKLKDYDPNTTRFACKMCRTILFGEYDLEDPPHSKSKHSFSSRKTKHGANRSTNQCQSLFLASGLDWMVGIDDAAEGKLSCPRCNGKLGLYKWHGTQCSCGSWVTPAIQIHCSRIDEVIPEHERQQQDPLAMLMSPLARLHVAGQPGV